MKSLGSSGVCVCMFFSLSLCLCFFSAAHEPVLLIGLVGYGVGTVMLGLSTGYGFATLSLFFTGCFAANTVVAKGMIGEVCEDTIHTSS
jgi:hypothetical protein